MEEPGLADFDLGPAPSPAVQVQSGWPTPAKVAVGCGSGCALLVLLEAGVLWTAFWFYLHLRPPEGMVAKIQAPARVTLGKSFPLTLTVRNEGDKAFSVHSVVGRQGLLRALDLTKAQPPPTGVGGPSGTRMFDTAIWQYTQPVEPGKTWQVRFDATARQAGTVDTALEIEVNGFPKPVPVHLEVRAPAPAQ